METLGDAVGTSEAPHARDFLRPGMEGVSEDDELRQSGLAQLVVLGDTLHSWSEEIARMWRFTRSNGITEGFHNKMETLSRQAYGFRNFENYRLRVKVLCS